MEIMGDFIAYLGHLALGTRLKRVGEALQAGVAEALTTHGISVRPGHIPLLIALRQNSMTVGDLASLLAFSQPGISRSLSELSRHGFVYLSPCKDRRMREVQLTGSGLALMTEIEAVLFPKVAAAAKALCDSLEGPLLDQLASIERLLATQPFAARIEAA